LMSTRANGRPIVETLPTSPSVIGGEVEIVEVKLGKTSLSPNQKGGYRRAVSEGYPLCLIHV